MEAGRQGELMTFRVSADLRTIMCLCLIRGVRTWPMHSVWACSSRTFGAEQRSHILSDATSLQQWGSKWLPSNWHFWERFVTFHLCITCSSLSQNLCKHIASGTNYYLTESHPGQNTLPGCRSGSSLMFQAHQLQQRKPQSQHNWTAHPLPLSLPWHLDNFACRQASTGVNKKTKQKNGKLSFLLFVCFDILELRSTGLCIHRIPTLLVLLKALSGPSSRGWAEPNDLQQTRFSLAWRDTWKLLLRVLVEI